MLWAVSTSAESPIVDGRFRPMSGELPTGTYRFRATRPLRAQRQNHLCCSDRGLGSGRWPSQLPLGEAQAPQARGVHGLPRHAEYPHSGRRGDRNPSFSPAWPQPLLDGRGPSWPLSRFNKPIPVSPCTSQTGTAVSLPGPPLSTFALSHATADDESAVSVRVENNGNPSPISQEGKN